MTVRAYTSREIDVFPVRPKRAREMASDGANAASAITGATRAAQQLIIMDAACDSSFQSKFCTLASASDGLSALTGFMMKEIIRTSSQPNKRQRLGGIPGRTIGPRPDYQQSIWWKMIQHPDISNPDSRIHHLFRKRFRVPFPLFRYLLTIARENKWFPEATNPKRAKLYVPLELKILGALRVLGRGSVFDDIAEITFASESLHEEFFHQFCCKIVTLYDQFVYAPRTSVELARVESVYRQMGFPGCVGSIDCVHVAWEGCPALWRNHYKGAKGYPSIAYEVVCDHNLFILATTCGFSGTTNDKTISRYDLFVDEVKRGAKYVDHEFQLMRRDGTWTTHRGGWLLCDGGYHRWRCMQCPTRHSSDADEIRFSRHIESVRKDIERTFGVLKGRFRILKMPVRFRDKDQVDNVFWTCAILHNMIRRLDFHTLWEEGVDWRGADGDHEVPVGEEDDPDPELRDLLGITADACVRRRRTQALVRYRAKTADFTYMGAGGGHVQRDQSWAPFRACLVEHFATMHARHSVVY